jgi:hypothetical protein
MGALRLVNHLPCIALLCSFLEERVTWTERVFSCSSATFTLCGHWPSPIDTQRSLCTTIRQDVQRYTTTYQRRTPPHCRNRTTLGRHILRKNIFSSAIQVSQAVVCLCVSSPHSLLLGNNRRLRLGVSIHHMRSDCALSTI